MALKVHVYKIERFSGVKSEKNGKETEYQESLGNKVLMSNSGPSLGIFQLSDI